MRVLVFLLLLASLSFGENEKPPTYWVAVTDKAAAVLEGFGCICKKWKEINFCVGREPSGPRKYAGWAKEANGIRFFCRSGMVIVPYSNIITFYGMR